MKPLLKQVTTSPNNSFKIKLFDEQEFKAEWHFHPQYELTYMIQSTGIRYVGDSMHQFERGDLVLVGKNLPHSWKTIDAKNEKVKCVVIQWDDSLFSNWFDKPEFTSIKKMLLKSSYGISFDKKTALSLENSFSSIYNQNPFKRFITFLNILNVLATSASIELLAGPSFGKDLSLKESTRVNVINNYIKDNYENEPSLTDISNKLSLSKEAFCRFFKKTFDKTYSSYVSEYRIAIASKMFVETDLSVSQIAYESGFNNLSFFYRQFKKHKQLSPKIYRQLYQRI
ncbi:AraC family transcriptional regulator [Polaribacter sp. Q13]|uniref:AraC family transcriptional regulator n=1 Tax=Polaribacter sp. Q13 TaxID=2806551 RepID=UPI00193B0D71|nr:AraC family transcriptional regulator [Polaribacter sp. Q13]QVY66257.1 helix-turn-helix domain-containing protein [Polaribacter sp. Q13]